MVITPRSVIRGASGRRHLSICMQLWPGCAGVVPGLWRGPDGRGQVVAGVSRGCGCSARSRSRPGGPATLVGARQRTLVGLLALNAGTLVPRARLVDALWGDHPPRTAVKSLHSHVARVRQALDECGLPGVLRHPRAPDTCWRCAPTRSTRPVRGRRPGARGGLAAGAPEPGRGLLGTAWRCGAATRSPTASPTGWAAAEVERLAEARLTATEDLLGRPAATRPAHRGRRRAGAAARDVPVARTPGRAADARSVPHRPAHRRPGRLPAAARAPRRGARRRPGPASCAPARRDPAPAIPRSTRRAPGDRPPMPRPAQLPARVGHFTGRAGELAALDAWLADPDAETQVAVIAGPAGIGKTALAVQWAHRIADRFPDGQLFLDLRGHEPAPRCRRPRRWRTCCAASACRATGSRPAAEQAGLYRSLLHDRRSWWCSTTPARPTRSCRWCPTDAGSLLVVTSRHRLAAAGHPPRRVPVDLDALSGTRRSALLRRVLGPAAVDGQPDAAGRAGAAVRPDAAGPADRRREAGRPAAARRSPNWSPSWPAPTGSTCCPSTATRAACGPSSPAPTAR